MRVTEGDARSLDWSSHVAFEPSKTATGARFDSIKTAKEASI